jgi:two-component system, OmpR family, catabolic regulation response regulator CreB
MPSKPKSISAQGNNHATPGAGPPRILIVEDEPAIADTLYYALSTEGYEPEHYLLGREALLALQHKTFALALLDIGLPDMNGIELLREMRKCSSLPVIFLTARNSELDRILGLEIGADDYVTKPFSPREVVARVRTVLRRTTPAPVTGPVLAFQLDSAGQHIHYHGIMLSLTRYEFLLLKTLLQDPLHIYSRVQLMQKIWAAPDHSLERTVDTHIKTLRAKLSAIRPDEHPIRTHRNQGYSLQA